MAATIQAMEKVSGQAREEPLLQAAAEEFLQGLAVAPYSALMLDYDGTLAPFRVDATKALPWSGVKSLIDAIRRTGRTRVALVTGRPAQSAARLLDLEEPVEVFGLHGAEHLASDGRLSQARIESASREALQAALAEIEAANLGFQIEVKINAVAVHWRGMSMSATQTARERALTILSEYSRTGGMQLLRFDGGLELRAGANKGDAVRAILSMLPSGTPAAYLGDDITDEDAFVALGEQGIGILVRRQWRPSAAQVWLRPPHQLRTFLKRWLQAVER